MGYIFLFMLSFIKRENEMDMSQGCYLLWRSSKWRRDYYRSRFRGNPGELFSELDRGCSFGERERNRWASRMIARAQFGSFLFFLFIENCWDEIKREIYIARIFRRAWIASTRQIIYKTSHVWLSDNETLIYINLGISFILVFVET